MIDMIKVNGTAWILIVRHKPGILWYTNLFYLSVNYIPPSDLSYIIYIRQSMYPPATITED